MPDPGDQYIPFLVEAGCEPGVIAHCRVVRDVAVRIADRILQAGTIPVERDLVIAGAVLHDIGRSQTHGMDHADAGGDICRKLPVPLPVCRIVETLFETTGCSIRGNCNFQAMLLHRCKLRRS